MIFGDGCRAAAKGRDRRAEFLGERQHGLARVLRAPARHDHRLARRDENARGRLDVLQRGRRGRFDRRSRQRNHEFGRPPSRPTPFRARRGRAAPTASAGTLRRTLPAHPPRARCAPPFGQTAKNRQLVGQLMQMARPRPINWLGTCPVTQRTGALQPSAVHKAAAGVQHPGPARRQRPPAGPVERA